VITSVGPVLTTRVARPGDLDEITRIEAGPDTVGYLGLTGRAYHDRAWADADQLHLVGAVGETVAGFVLVAGLARQRVELRRIVLTNEFRGRGLGRELVRGAIAHVEKHYRPWELWLDVKPGNHRAQLLYASEGFRPDGTIPDPYPQQPGDVLLLMTRAARRERED
jgi:diamine N-acetyltransferase